MHPGKVVLERLAAVGGKALPDVGRKLEPRRLELRDEVVAAPFADVLLAHLVVWARAERLVDGVEAELGGECRKMGDTYAEIGYIKGKIKAYTKANEGKKQAGDADPTDEKIIDALKARLKELLGEGDKK